MRVLNIEDDTIKHNDICKALSGCGIKDVEWSNNLCLLYTSPSPRDRTRSRMPSSA